MTENLIGAEHAGNEDRAVRWGQITLWGVVFLVVVIIGLGLGQAFAPRPEVGKPAPDFTIATYDGNTYTLSELQGKVVVINFWASWCVPCAEEAPALQAAWETYQNDDVLFIGIGYVDSDHKAKEFMARYGITYPNGPDLGTKISDRYNITGVPETFIVDPNGMITFVKILPLTYDELVREIERAKASAE